MATRKTRAKATKDAPKKERAPRKVAGVDYEPSEIYAYCIENQPVGVTEVATKFEISPASVKAVVLDFCAMDGQIPPRFAARGTTASGMIKVRALRLQGERGDEDRQPEDGSPVQTILGNAYLSAIGAEHNSALRIAVDRENNSITLTLADESDED